MAGKKCYPGVICIENITLMAIVIVIIIGVYMLMYHYKPKNIIVNERVNERINKVNDTSETTPWYGFFTRPNFGYNNLPGDVLMNPYVPPLKDDRYLVPPPMGTGPYGRMPINVSTNVGAVNTSYRQMGILNSMNGDNIMLPLMGRPLFVNRNKYQYYTMSDQNTSIKLPISRNGRSCTNEYGCDEIYNGDTVYVQGYNKAFKVTIYENDTIQYIPYT